MYLQQHGQQAHTRDGRNPPIVPRIVPTDDMPKRTLSRLVLTPLHKRNPLPQLVPQLGIVRVRIQTVVVHRQIKVGKKELAEVEQPDIDITTASNV